MTQKGAWRFMQNEVNKGEMRDRMDKSLSQGVLGEQNFNSLICEFIIYWVGELLAGGYAAVSVGVADWCPLST